MNCPVRNQLDSVDCGPTCIQIIAAYYKKDIPLSILKEYCNVTRLGISLRDIIEGCKKIGFKAIAAHVNLDDIKRMPLPAILYWRQEHYVVLYKTKQNKNCNLYYIIDPAYGKIKLEESYFLKDWKADIEKGIAIIIEPTEHFFNIPQQNISVLKKINNYFKPFKYLSEHRTSIINVLLLFTITFICSLIIPILLQKIIDKGIVNKDMNFIYLMLISQLFLILGNILSKTSSNILLFKIGTKIGVNISSQYIHKLVRLPIRFFDTKLGTDLLQRLTDEEKIRNFLTYTTNSIILALLNTLVYSTVLLYYNKYVFLIFFIFTTSSLLMVKLILKRRKLIDYALFSNISNKKNIELELINGMTEIKINKAYDIYLAKWENIQNLINRLYLKSLRNELLLTSITGLLNTLRDVIITGGCAYFVIKEDMSIGVMITVTYILGQLSGALNQITIFSKTSQDSNLAYARMEEVLNVPDENDLNISHRQQTVVSDGFRLENVSFKYDGSFNSFVLKNLSIKIFNKNVTAIVGASGSGKTTLLKLLLAFYSPQKGSVYLDNIRMNNLDIDEFRIKCGVVMQDGYIFSETIANNIAMGEESVDEKRLKKAASIACIDDFIDCLPMKYNTKIGKSGTDLSGGQKQRLLIARAVYKNPEYLFFDEATNALDANNEREIMNNLQTFYSGKTVVIVAHRLSTVQNADNIIVLDKGKIVEQGTHDNLVQKQSIYYKLVKNQLELGS